MLKIKHFLVAALLSILLLSSLYTVCYAEEVASEENTITNETSNKNNYVDELPLTSEKEIERRDEYDSIRPLEKQKLAQLEKEYRANKIPKAGDRNTAIVILQNITIMSTLILIVVLVYAARAKMKIRKK